MTKLLVIDDHWVVHEGLERVFASAPDVFILAKAQNLNEAFYEARCGADKIDVILLDAALREESGIEAISQLKNICTRARVLVLSMLAENPHALRAFEQGANGFVSKGASPSELLEAVRTVAEGRRFVTSEVGQLLAERLTRHNDLSPRESEVVRFFTSGRRCGEIAHVMALSPKTVSAHKASAMRKLGVSSDVELIRWAIGHGMA